MGCMVAQDCTSQYCNNGTCEACAMQMDCMNATGTYCDTASGNCVPTKANGTTCADDFECIDGFCVEDYMVAPGNGVCCDRACDAVCEACNVSGSEGTCTCTTSLDPEDECQGMTPNCMTCGMCGM